MMHMHTLVIVTRMMYAASGVCMRLRDEHHAYPPMPMPMPMCRTRMGYPPIHIGTYTYVYPCTYTACGYPPSHCVPTRTYHCVYTYTYMQVPVVPTHAQGLVCAWVLRGVPMRWCAVDLVRECAV